MTRFEFFKFPQVRVALGLFILLALSGGSANAAASAGCEGGGFTIVLGGVTLPNKGSISPSALGTSLLVRGKYVEFQVDPATFGISDYTLTGAFNALDITEGRRTVVFAAKTPDHRGLRLTDDLKYEARDSDILLERRGRGLKMKIQAKDCAQGGTFQMEPEREDGSPTDITHTLALGVFYFDNPNFRNPPALPLCPAAGPFTPSCYPVPVTPRINFANDLSPKFVGRDSAQVATRLSQSGRTSVWRVSSGGRMGGVLGEDSVEVAPPATTCTHDCQAQNQVQGTFPVLGFPFPVPAPSRLP